jgi:hypothetical protein
MALEEVACPSIAHRDAESIAKVVLGVARDVDAVPTALLPAELVGRGGRLGR